MLILQILAALILLLLACAVWLLFGIRRRFQKLYIPVPFKAENAADTGPGGPDSGEQTEAERAAEKKYTEGILNILNYSAENARKGDAER